MVSTPDAVPASSAAAKAAAKVMLLSVWAEDGPGAAWHARLVLPDAQAIEFNSPFALAQHLNQLARDGVAARPGGQASRARGGLR